MIASLNGILILIGKSDIVLEVNGVGYLLNVSSKLIASLDVIGSKLILFTDLQIKDDKIVMYGFASSRDQNIFKYLTLTVFVFGLIHGLGFGRYFNLMVQEDSSLISILGFAFGIEFAQLVYP